MTATTLPTSARGRKLLDRWLLDPTATFLNHGSFGAVPKVVLAEQARWRNLMERQPVRFMADEHLPGALAGAMAPLARLVGAAPEDMAFVDNATAGVNAVLRSLELEPGDEILTTSHVYPAVRNALHRLLGRHGARIVEVDLPMPVCGPDDVVARVAQGISPRTRLGVFDHITSPSALIMPIKALANLCRAAGALTLIDGAHGPGMIDLDIAALGCDFYTGNAHKWLFAPKGTAFLWVARPQAPRIHPLTVSHYDGQGFQAEFGWTGTRDFTAWLSVPSAIAFHQELGGSVHAEANRALAREAGHFLRARWNQPIAGPDDMLGSMATVGLPARFTGGLAEAKAVNARLWHEHRVEVPAIAFDGRLWIRVSAQAYNEMDDYARLAAAIAAL